MERTPEKLRELIDGVEVKRHDCTLADIRNIVNFKPGAWYETAYFAFKFGFYKGRQAERAEQKKKKQKQKQEGTDHA